MSTIFETHAHYDDERFDGDRDDLIKKMTLHGIEPLINVGSTFEGSKESLTIAHTYPKVFAAVGIHPSEITDFGEPEERELYLSQATFDDHENEVIKWLKEAAEDKKTVAIGEIGLDYYWEKEAEVREEQRAWFARQIDLAAEKKLPVIIHSRDACEDTLQEMRRAAGLGVSGVIHCFSYSLETAIEYIKMGYYIGIGGVVTFKNAKKLKEVAATIPLERILLETDCPYMAPEPFRGERNDSTLLPYVVQAIAKLREITEDEVIEVTHTNAARLFFKTGM